MGLIADSSPLLFHPVSILGYLLSRKPQTFFFLFRRGFLLRCMFEGEVKKDVAFSVSPRAVAGSTKRAVRSDER